MSPISATFNAFADLQPLMLVLLFWIAASHDADKAKEKVKKRRLTLPCPAHGLHRRGDGLAPTWG